MKKYGVFILAFIIISFILNYSQNGWAEDGLEKININTASATELTQLKGVGTVIAQRIVDYRQQNGNFTTPNDLLNVKGIGPKIFSNNEEMITVGNTEQSSPTEIAKNKTVEQSEQH